MIIFIPKNYLLKDITDFAQYIKNFTYNKEENKLITIIGELHGFTINCEQTEKDGKSKIKEIDIVEYIKNISKDVNKKVILEYDKYSQPEGITYGNINKIDKEINEKNLNIKKTPIDFRRQYLGIEIQNRLYGDPNLYLYSKEDILKIYIDPFFLHVGEKTKFITGEENYNESVQILYTDYLPKVGDQFNKIAVFIKNNWDKIDENDKKITIHNLKVLWAQLGDFYILRELFKEEDIDEYIILIGKAHYYNITKYLDEVLTKPLNKKHRDKIYFQKITDKSVNKFNNCINIKDTAVIIHESKVELYKDFRKPTFQMFKVET
jgi:hypothetical protein